MMIMMMMIPGGAVQTTETNNSSRHITGLRIQTFKRQSSWFFYKCDCGFELETTQCKSSR